ncbi:penicillin-binding transpeptidase domain-containing protein [Algoriphagus halophilus]|uniref:penicillin-binding transpeptidase domain-containing protein n=1 Tax=Algoriphagus halophilus TaxID=226505 RepID=UPI00358DEC6D
MTFAQSNWNQPFEDCGLKGSTTIYDYQKKQWLSSDIEDSQDQTLPASTFKLVNTLIALDTRAVENEDEIIPWIDDYDTVKYGHRPNIYHSMSMKEAFRLSAGWAYIELAKKIGKPKYKEYLTAIGYGNVDLSIDGDDFWNFGDFGISPANQIEILIGIYEESLPFSEQSFQTLKEMMIEEKTDNYIIRAKTGWTREGGKDTGWWVGYLETSDNVYFFATRLIKDRSENNPNFGSCRKTITKEILKQLGVL